MPAALPDRQGDRHSVGPPPTRSEANSLATKRSPTNSSSPVRSLTANALRNITVVLAASLPFALVACGADGGDQDDGGVIDGPSTASYVYLSPTTDQVIYPDFVLIGGDLSVENGVVAAAEPYSLPLPELGERELVWTFDAAGPRAVVVASSQIHHLRPDRAGWDLVAAPADAEPADPCERLRSPKAVDENTFVLLPQGYRNFGNCGAGAPEADDFFVFRRYQRGVGWSIVRPDDLATVRARLRAAYPTPEDPGFLGGFLLDYDDEGRTMTYLLRSFYELGVVRVDLADWSFELLSQKGNCEFSDGGPLGNGDYWVQCHLGGRYHCTPTDCVEVIDDVPNVDDDRLPHYDRMNGRRVSISRWLESYASHTRIEGPPDLSSCEPALFPEPNDTDLVRVVTPGGELVYDPATGAMTPAAQPMRDEIFGSACYFKGSRAPFFFRGPAQ